jgi:hypothetical protein
MLGKLERIPQRGVRRVELLIPTVFPNDFKIVTVLNEKPCLDLWLGVIPKIGSDKNLKNG